MTWTPILEILADLGAATVSPLWLPVTAWTVLALPLWVLLGQIDRLHPLAEYRLSQVLLAALPLGIATVGVVEMLPDASRSAVLPSQSVVLLPPIETSTVSAPGLSWSWMHAVGLLTLGVGGIGLFQLGHLVLQVVAVGRVRQHLEAIPPSSLRDEVNRLQDQLNVDRPVLICTSSDAAVPITLGGFRPMILVPERLVEATKEIRMTLRHELVHIRRWDDVAQFAERIVAAVFAAHPLVSRLRRRIDQARERACDAAVLDDGRTPAGDYARLLATFADGSGHRRLGALSLSESPSSLEGRLSAMNSSIPSLLSSRTTLGIALVVGGLTLTLGVVACSDSVAPSTSTETTAATESSSAAATDDEEVYMVVEDPPELVGGMEALQDAVSYPEMAKEAGIEGRAIVQFVVDENGNVTDPTVTRGAHEVLNEAALEAVKGQTFKPGKQEGQSVPVQMSLPVTFGLGNGSNDESDGSDATSETNSGGLLFEKAGIQVVRILMNAEGDLLLDDEGVELSNLTDAVRQHITEDPARVVLLHDDAAPTDRIAAAKSSLGALDLQKVYIKKVE